MKILDQLVLSGCFRRFGFTVTFGNTLPFVSNVSEGLRASHSLMPHQVATDDGTGTAYSTPAVHDGFAASSHSIGQPGQCRFQYSRGRYNLL